MNILAYHSLSPLQRRGLAFFLSLIFVIIAYAHAYLLRFASWETCGVALSTEQTTFESQAKVIAQYPKTQAKVAGLQQELNVSTHENLIRIAENSGVKNLQWLPLEEGQAKLSFDCDWTTLNNFLQKLSETPFFWEIFQFEAQQIPNEHEITITLRLKEIKALAAPSIALENISQEKSGAQDPFSIAHSAEAEMRLLGILQQDNNFFAYFLLPDQKIVCLKKDDVLENSGWKIIEITKNQVVLENINTHEKSSKKIT